MCSGKGIGQWITSPDHALIRPLARTCPFIQAEGGMAPPLRVRPRPPNVEFAAAVPQNVIKPAGGVDLSRAYRYTRRFVNFR